MSKTAARLRTARSVYIGFGLFLTMVRSASLFTWAAWHIFHAPLASNGQPVSFFGTFMIGFIRVMVMPVLWPAIIFAWATGKASLAEVLLYPWFATYPG